ncbi:DUF262 domain-containing protein [Microbacterium stercoris]|uniref:DUF262 domain-containing protein n=1 Tax=Microbacterium stercoris TaxID=2820289 RepID=A0A939QJ82_9MICO|nr:DUF262 domain-containing protein [Microbacterium stercoris]MBO3662682.1 DUF262 domain-containing protein [Microbacterium stercoris]
MAESTEFNHDQLGHILADHLVAVPEFQRAYSWEQVNVQEYLLDLERAREKKSAHFMGTLVFAKADDDSGRRKIVDGQQRLATTAVLFIAIRDRLQALRKENLAENTTKKYLRRFSIREEGDVDSLILSPADQDAYDAILEGQPERISATNKIRVCYEECHAHLEKLAPTSRQYKKLIDVIDQLDKDVQVLIAVASNLPEAYVIFETLNDRGADLTTADLLKNYLFSEAKQSEFAYVQHGWNSLETSLGSKPDDMVRFVRHEYMSRHGRVTRRKLYRALQDDLQENPGAKRYIQRMKASQQIYLALRDPEHEYWKNSRVDVRDALMAYRRFGFESSYPLLLSAFREWEKPKATQLLLKIAKWSVRAQFVGRLGGETAEEAFASAAAAVASGSAKNQTDVRARLARLIPTDAEFTNAFKSSGKLKLDRAKYLLAMLEKAADAKAQRPERALDWTSRTVTIEHVLSQSTAHGDDSLQVKIDEIGNLALLERRLNHQLGSKPFSDKCEVYAESDFQLTRELATRDAWSTEEVSSRTAELAELACFAWPAR